MAVLKNLARYRTRGLFIAQDEKKSFDSDVDFPLPRYVPKCQIMWDAKGQGLKVVPHFSPLFKVHLHGFPFKGDDTTNTTGNGTQSTENTVYQSTGAEKDLKEFYFSSDLLAPKHEAGVFVGDLRLIFRIYDDKNFLDKILIIETHHDLDFSADLTIKDESSLFIVLKVYDPGIDTIPKGER